MNTFLKSFILLICVSLSSTALGEEKKADSETDADASKSGKKKDEKKESKKDWGVSFGTSLRIGQGTFVSLAEDSEVNTDLGDVPGDPSNFKDRVALGFNAGASYNLDPVNFGISVGAVQWLTAGGGINGVQEFRFQDVGASVGWNGYTIEAIDSRISAGLGFQFPTSEATQLSNLVLGTSANVGISKTFFKKLNLRFGLSGSKDFHSNITPSIDPEDVGAENVIFRAGTNEKLENGTVVLGGVNSEYSLGFSLSASFPVIEKLRMSIRYGLSTYWSYDRENDDAFTPNLRDENGNLIADTGRGVGQGTGTGISLSYPILSDWNGLSLGASAGISTGQSPKTSDNKSFNFPFWNFNGAAANRSSLRFGLSASY